MKPNASSARPTTPRRRARLFRGPATWVAAATLGIGLAACGGGGSSEPASAPAAVTVTVVDAFGAAVPGVTVRGPNSTASTNAEGVAVLVVDAAPGVVGLTISQPTFQDKSITVPVGTDGLPAVQVELERKTAQAGGSLTSRGSFAPSVDGARRELTFETELVLVDGKGQPIRGLTAASFALKPCAPDAQSARADCTPGGAGGADVGYTPDTAAPSSVVTVEAAPARPYAAVMLLDQSTSIAQTDPTGARLFATKAFLSELGSDDRAMLATFASGSAARIPTTPLTLYPPFLDPAAAPSQFPTLDGLASMVGGNTPLFEAADAARAALVNDTSLASGIGRAVVIFSDGEDTTCGNAAACTASRDAVIQQANADGVRIFTIGLSTQVNLGGLAALADGTGGAFLYADNAEQLLPLYGSVGRLLSLSLPTYRLRWTVRSGGDEALPANGSLVGRVQVSTAEGTFDVPFLVRLP